MFQRSNLATLSPLKKMRKIGVNVEATDDSRVVITHTFKQMEMEDNFLMALISQKSADNSNIMLNTPRISWYHCMAHLSWSSLGTWDSLAASVGFTYLLHGQVLQNSVEQRVYIMHFIHLCSQRLQTNANFLALPLQ